MYVFDHKNNHNLTISIELYFVKSLSVCSVCHKIGKKMNNTTYTRDRTENSNNETVFLFFFL